MSTRSNSNSFLSRLGIDAAERAALVIGNGIHQYNATPTGLSWNDLIQKMAASHGLKSADHAASLALTEVYDCPPSAPMAQI